MAKLFNSHWIIVGLVLIAAFVVYAKVITPYRALSQTPVDDESNSDLDAILIEEGSWDDTNSIEALKVQALSPQLVQIDAGSVHWNTAPSRDPFVARATLNDSQIEAVQSKADSPKTPVKKRVASFRPTVTAIVHSEDTGLAVIGGDIVRSGDEYGDYRVSQILGTEVELRHKHNGQAVKVKVSK
ncbi:MAG: hypothetical protein AAF465_04825 [Pseudomonadota bacterium]